MELSFSKPEGLTIKTCGLRFGVPNVSSLREQIVMLGDYEIPMSDFCFAIEYVLTNTDLDTDDPRIPLVAKIKSMATVPGYNTAGGKLDSVRYEVMTTQPDRIQNSRKATTKTVSRKKRPRSPKHGKDNK
jgi:hypothetical protein